jgi:hypothetical protein
LRYILWRSYQNLANPGRYNIVKRIEDVAVRARLGIGEYAPASEEIVQVAEDDTAEYTSEEQQIIADAKANGSYMKAPNGQPTKLNEKQWAQVRTANFKKWFGDWEMFFKKNFLLNSKPVAALTGDEFAKDGIPLTTKVGEFYKNNFNGKIERKGVGVIILDERSVKDSLSHGLGRLKSSAFAAVPNVISDGLIIDRQENWKGRGYSSVTFAAPINIGDETYVGIVVANEVLNNQDGTHRFYLHEVVLQKNLQSEEFKTGMDTGSKLGDIANVIRNIVSASDNVSKIVDENGEPKVVYHGTRNGFFTKFDTKGAGKTRDTGVWFADSEYNAAGYSDRNYIEFDTPHSYESLIDIIDQANNEGQELGDVKVKKSMS